jgi:hypothetical protein
MILWVVFLAACGTDTVEEVDTDAQEVDTIQPQSGDWTVVTSGWSNDNCNATEALTDVVSVTFSDVVTPSFMLTLYEEGDIRLGNRFKCTHTEDDVFACDDFFNDVPIEGIDATVNMGGIPTVTLNSETDAAGRGDLTIDCTGTDCGLLTGGMPFSAFPCTTTNNWTAVPETDTETETVDAPEEPLSPLAESLRTHVETVVFDMTPRNYTHTENLDKVAAYIKGQLESVSSDVSEQVFEVDGRTYRNVIARFGPESSDMVVIGAHYDVAGEFPGADDNASGIAGLIEIAKLLSEKTLTKRVEVVAYSVHEPPYFESPNMGSAVHARSLVDAGVTDVTMFSLDLIGYYCDTPGCQSYPDAGLTPIYGNKGDYILLMTKTGQEELLGFAEGVFQDSADLRVAALAAPPEMDGVDWSDHSNYWDQGWDAVMITDTGMFRNGLSTPRYHSAYDTVDTLDFENMGQVVLGSTQVVLELAQ